MARRVIAILTDFGWSAHFAGTMKSVILGIDPDAQIVDITHGIPPQAVEEGAFILGTVLPFLPSGAVCVAVVDPGVGTNRRPIAVETGGIVFVGPDNGLISAALGDEARAGGSPVGVAGSVGVPSGCNAFHLSNSRYFRLPVSTTFHGRDIFAPVAAHAALGVPIGDFGEPILELLAFPPWRATRCDDGALSGRVISVDSFGNLITDIRGADLPAGRPLVNVGGREIAGLSMAYQDGPEIAAYVGSSGYLEIGRRNSSAAAALRTGSGGEVRVYPGLTSGPDRQELAN